jgi:type II secretory pathway pseudopilin PulG
MSRTVTHTISGRREGERGFALLEILVAFLILALGLGAISTGIAVAMRSDGRTQTSRVAFRIAQSRLEAAGLAKALLPGRREGEIANHYKWQETVTAAVIGTEPPGVKPGQTAANPGMAPFWVEVTVQAADGSSAMLAALKLVPEAKVVPEAKK